jgi:hypothetical protein
MPQRIFRLNALGKQVGVGVAGTYHATLNAFAKNNAAVPYCIPNELICAELARFIRLPVPPTALVADGANPPWFACLSFDLNGNTLPPVDPVRCYKELPHLSTGLLLFDIWVANCDRHVSNFQMDTSTKPPLMNIFDHSHAICGYVAGQGEARLTALMDRLGISVDPNDPTKSGTHRHCLVDVVSSDDHFGDWMGRIKQTPDFYIESVVREAEDYGLSKQESDVCIRFLKHRRDNLEVLIKTHQNEFKSITNWRLFP